MISYRSRTRERGEEHSDVGRFQRRKFKQENKETSLIAHRRMIYLQSGDFNCQYLQQYSADNTIECREEQGQIFNATITSSLEKKNILLVPMNKTQRMRSLLTIRRNLIATATVLTVMVMPLRSLGFHHFYSTTFEMRSSRLRSCQITSGSHLLRSSKLFYQYSYDNNGPQDHHVHDYHSNYNLESDYQNAAQILGLKGATLDMNVIKRAYKHMALKYHPDVSVQKDSSPEEKKHASDLFAQVNWAYQYLIGETSSSNPQPINVNVHNDFSHESTTQSREFPSDTTAFGSYSYATGTTYWSNRERSRQPQQTNHYKTNTHYRPNAVKEHSPSDSYSYASGSCVCSSEDGNWHHDPSFFYDLNGRVAWSPRHDVQPENLKSTVSSEEHLPRSYAAGRSVWSDGQDLDKQSNVPSPFTYQYLSTEDVPKHSEKHSSYATGRSVWEG